MVLWGNRDLEHFCSWVPTKNRGWVCGNANHRHFHHIYNMYICITMLITWSNLRHICGDLLYLYKIIHLHNFPYFKPIDSAFVSWGVFLWYAAVQFKGQHQIEGGEDDKSSRNVGGVTGTVDSGSSVCCCAVSMRRVFIWAALWESLKTLRNKPFKSQCLKRQLQIGYKVNISVSISYICISMKMFTLSCKHKVQ